jgi:hypothetical protein
MSNFNWIKDSGIYYQAKVGEFLAEVWQVGATGKWKFRWVGIMDSREYETAVIAKAACELRGISQIVCACNELGYTVRVGTPIA